MDDLPREDVLSAIDTLVEKVLARAGITAPPVDAIVLAQRHLGMLICLDRRQQQRGRAQRIDGQKQIFLRPEPTEERHQWTVAHEIGEHFKVEILQALKLDPAETKAMTGESLANLFAHHLLVPTCWFKEDAVRFEFELLELKQRYRTASHEVLAWRFLDLSSPCIVTVIDNDKIHRRRSNAWRTRKQLHPVEEKCRVYVHQHGTPYDLSESGWSVHCWPVHQEDWKREILRSVVEESEG